MPNDSRFAVRDKLVALRFGKFGHLPPALNAAQILIENGVPLLVVECGTDRQENPHDLVLGQIPRLRLNSSLERVVPGPLLQGFRLVHAIATLVYLSLTQGKPRLIVAHGLIEQMMAWVLNKALGISYGVHVHEVFDRKDVRGFLTVLALKGEGAALRGAEWLAFPDAARAEIYRQRYHFESPLFLIPNCPRLRPRPIVFDLKKKLGLPNSSIVMGYLGGIGPMNGLELAIEALEKVPDLHFVLWGWVDPSYLEKLRAVARATGTESRVHFAGELKENKWEHLAGCDISYCLYEPGRLRFQYAAMASNKFMESLSCGVPVITNNSTDFVEFLRKEKVGLAVNEISASALAQTLREMCASADTRREWSERGYQVHRREFHYEFQFQSLRDHLASTFDLPTHGEQPRKINLA